MHSFWLTKNYVILPEAPLHSKKPLNLFFTGNILSTLCWDSSKPLYFHVFHRDGRGLVASVPLRPAFFTFHTANAFEIDDTLILDCAAFDSGDIIHQVQSFGQPRTDEYTSQTKERTINVNGIMHPVPPQNSYGDFNRYTIDLKSQTASKKTFLSNVEFPRFNHEISLGSYGYVYGCRMYVNEKQETGSLVKIGLEGGEVKEFLVHGHSCSEPIFAARPGATAEDDGVLLTFVNSTECCYLMVVDAREMKELARIKIGQFTAVTFHGSYVDHEFKMVSPN
jgi:torulene dioxygenase